MDLAKSKYGDDTKPPWGKDKYDYGIKPSLTARQDA
jgi:hypothetical protein